MLRLNIPLFTNQKTRPNIIKGRVLWIFCGWITILPLSFIISSIWFTRDTISAYAPNNTMATVHLSLSSKAWTKLINGFGDLPLISERPFTITDFADLKPKEISLFILSNNESAVAIRANEHDLNRKMLNFYGINIQKLGKNRWLLSNRPLPYATEGRTKWSFGSIWPGTIGTLRIADFFGHIATNKDGFVVDIPKTKKTSNYLPALPETAIAAASFQPRAGIDLSVLFNKFSILLDTLGTIESEQIGKKMEENGGIVVLTDNGFLFETVMDSSILSQILESAAVFRNLTTKSMPMPDGSLVQEMIIDQTNINFDSIWIDGLEVKSVKTKNSQFLAFDGEKTDLIASNQVLLEDYLIKKQEKVSNRCGLKNRLIFFKPKEVKNALFKERGYIENPILIKAALKFKEISLNTTKMYLCF